MIILIVNIISNEFHLNPVFLLISAQIFYGIFVTRYVCIPSNVNTKIDPLCYLKLI